MTTELKKIMDRFTGKYVGIFPPMLFSCPEDNTSMHFILCLKNTTEDKKYEIVKLMNYCNAEVSFEVQAATNFSIVIVDHDDVVDFNGPAFTLQYVADCLLDVGIKDISDYRQHATSHIAQHSSLMEVVYLKKKSWDSLLKQEEKIWIKNNCSKGNAWDIRSDLCKSTVTEEPKGIGASVPSRANDNLEKDNVCSQKIGQSRPNISKIVVKTDIDMASYLAKSRQTKQTKAINNLKINTRTHKTDPPKPNQTENQIVNVVNLSGLPVKVFQIERTNTDHIKSYNRPSTVNKLVQTDVISEINRAPDMLEDPNNLPQQARPQSSSHMLNTTDNDIPRARKECEVGSKCLPQCPTRSEVFDLSDDYDSDDRTSIGALDMPEDRNCLPQQALSQSSSPVHNTDNENPRARLFLDDFHAESSDEDSPIQNLTKPKKWSFLDDFQAESSDEDWPIPDLNKPNKRSRNPYSDEERCNILKYIVKHSLYSRVKGREMWCIMERRKVCPNRTWQSMKEHYLKKILTNLGLYPFLTAEQKKRLVRCC